MRSQVIAFLVFVVVVGLMAAAISGVFMATGPTENQAPADNAPKQSGAP